MSLNNYAHTTERIYFMILHIVKFGGFLHYCMYTIIFLSIRCTVSIKMTRCTVRRLKCHDEMFSPECC